MLPKPKDGEKLPLKNVYCSIIYKYLEMILDVEVYVLK